MVIECNEILMKCESNNWIIMCINIDRINVAKILYYYSMCDKI